MPNRSTVSWSFAILLCCSALPGSQAPAFAQGQADTALLRDQCNAEDEESDSFVDMLTCGVGCTETLVEYDENPDGEITIGRVDPMKVRWDPASRKRNMTDAAWVQIDKEMPLADIKAEWPEKADELTAANIDVADDLDDQDPHNATEAPYDAMGTCANLYCHGNFTGGTVAIVSTVVTGSNRWINTTHAPACNVIPTTTLRPKMWKTGNTPNTTSSART